MKKGKKILILSNHFITLYNFRRELIQKLVKEGHEVFISMPKSDDNKYFINLGCKVIETDVDRRGINPISDFRLVLKYIKIMRMIEPDMIFSYTIKPNIYGSIASNISRFKQISNVTGTGSTFLKKSLVSEIAKLLYKISIKNSYKVYFQNSGDKEFFVNNGLVKDNYEMLPGSGVNLELYHVSEMPPDRTICFIFIGRIMELKGINEYLECAKIIKGKFPDTMFYVAGFVEEEKYKSIINEYHSQGIINYIGFQKEIKTWIKDCHCTILPSHGGEGVPNVLLESSAMGRICIASNINGSKEVVEDFSTGFLFEAGNVESLISKVEFVIKMKKSEKEKMGLNGRTKVENEFNREIVVEKYIKEINSL